MGAMNREASERIATSPIAAAARDALPGGGPELFVPADLAHGVALELVELAAEKGLWLDSTIDPSTPPRARGDAGGIRQTLRHLAEHALAATESGYIAVALNAEASEPGLCTLVFSVSDTAPPLTPEQRGVLAGPLRGHAQFGCEERPGGGNRVWFAVPAEAIGAEPPPESPADRLEQLTAWARDRGGRILVVDDSTTNRTIASALLRKAGLSVVLASGGTEALRLLESEAVDAVLMDVAMPGMDGLAATAAIRAMAEPQAGVPIIAMTAHAFPEDRVRCLSAGMDDYVTKPFQTIDLLEALARRLR